METKVDLYAQEGSNARHVGTAKLFKNLSNSFRRVVKTNYEVFDTSGYMHRATIYACDTRSVVPVQFIPPMKGLMKGSTKKVTLGSTGRVDSISREESDRNSEGGNSGEGGIFGKTCDDVNNDDGTNGAEKNVLLLDEQM